MSCPSKIWRFTPLVPQAPLPSAGLRERSVLVNSLSKTYSMTGWRVGYCAAPKALTDAMLLVLAQSSRGPATFIQDAAAEALSGSQDCVAQMRAEYSRRGRERALEFPWSAAVEKTWAVYDELR